MIEMIKKNSVQGESGKPRLTQPAQPQLDDLVAALKDLRKPSKPEQPKPPEKPVKQPKPAQPKTSKPVDKPAQQPAQQKLSHSECGKLGGRPRLTEEQKGKRKAQIKADKTAQAEAKAEAKHRENQRIQALESDEKHLAILQESLSKLSKKALKKLNTLLDSENDRVKMQAALGAIRATVQALTKDTSTGGGGASINIFTSAQAVAVGPGEQGAGQEPQGQADPTQPQPAKRTGQPIMIVK